MTQESSAKLQAVEDEVVPLLPARSFQFPVVFCISIVSPTTFASAATTMGGALST